MKKIVLFCLLIQYCFCCFSSESETRGEIIVITNRLGDPLKESCDKLQNYVDQKLELKVYRFHKGDSLFCVKKNGFNELEKWLSDSGDWILFVHGDGKSFKDAAVRGLKIQHIYDVNVIVFAWPSKMTNGTGIKNVKNSKKNIETGINSFRDLLIMIQKYKKEHQWPGIDNHISLFLHSLGNYYLEYAVNNSLLKNIDDELFDNLILNAAAVEQEGHVDWLSRLDIQKRIYVNSNKHDFTLNGLRLFSKAGKLLGERVKHPI